jgi:hypothetical protein
LNVHASRSPDTFAADMVESGASLVLAMSPFGYGHDPDGTAAPGNASVAGARVLPLHAAATTATQSTITGANRLDPGPARPVSFARIGLTASLKPDLAQRTVGPGPFASGCDTVGSAHAILSLAALKL